MYSCPNCRATVPFGVKFCANCGIPLNWPTQRGIQPPAGYERREAGGWGQRVWTWRAEGRAGERTVQRQVLDWVIALVIVIVLLGGALRYGCDTFFGTTAPPSAPSAEGKVSIRYTSSTMAQLGESSWGQADPGYTFLVLDLDIENQGYDSFKVYTALFSVVVNNVSYDEVGFAVEASNLKSVDLLDGGRVTGTVAFEVPVEVSSAGFEPKYWDYGYTECRVEWIKQ